MDINVKIMDYQNVEKVVSITDFEHVVEMYIDVVSGDEVLHVIYDDEVEEEIDSNHHRNLHVFEGRYYIYDDEEDLNLLDDPEFVNRENSYEYAQR